MLATVRKNVLKNSGHLLRAFALLNSYIEFYRRQIAIIKEQKRSVFELFSNAKALKAFRGDLRVEVIKYRLWLNILIQNLINL